MLAYTPGVYLTKSVLGLVFLGFPSTSWHVRISHVFLAKLSPAYILLLLLLFLFLLLL